MERRRRWAWAVGAVLIALMPGCPPPRADAQTGRPPAEGACEVLIQFYNLGSPGSPGVAPDSRFGARLNVEGSVYAVLPADRNGFVRFFGAEGRPVPFSAVRLYMPYAYTQTGFSEPGIGPGDQLAVCGYNGVQVPAGA
jgi:hypothetical protein